MLTSWEAHLYCCVVIAIFVLPFYLDPNIQKLNRNAPQVIRFRLMSVLASSVIILLLTVRLLDRDWKSSLAELGLTTSGGASSTVLGIILTCVLFSTSIVDLAHSWLVLGEDVLSELNVKSLFFWRNFIVVSRFLNIH